MTDTENSPGHPKLPLPQQNLQVAVERSYEALESQTEEQMCWLGAKQAARAWRVGVLGDTFDVDLTARRIVTSAGDDASLHWIILVLHYLAVTEQPEPKEPSVTFADLATARSYASVYDGRVIKRLCYTAGRDLATLATAAEALGAQPVADSGDATFDFRPFPRITLRLIWHAPDDEFPASATLLLPENIESYLCSEDIVVLSESLVARLCGRPF